ncbi:endonuclease [Sphaerothrix gracilis]|uniref:endonuclease n=1 Tax=Sphaerothrix gracilis TaxID=3151835 RepID=UPI0031FC9F12
MTGCYLLHFEQPISSLHTTRHYLGWSSDIESRIAHHQAGEGSKLCQVAKARGIGFTLARTWAGDRSLERRLKNRKNSPRLCPICQAQKSKTPA